MTSPTEEKVEKIDNQRRGLFGLAALPLLALGLGSRAFAASAPAAPASCDTGTLTSFQSSQRKTLKYRVATEPAKKCGTCMFYSGAPDGCGKCQLMLNGPVAAANVCDGWVKKA